MLSQTSAKWAVFSRRKRASTARRPPRFYTKLRGMSLEDRLALSGLGVVGGASIVANADVGAVSFESPVAEIAAAHETAFAPPSATAGESDAGLMRLPPHLEESLATVAADLAVAFHVDKAQPVVDMLREIGAVTGELRPEIDERTEEPTGDLLVADSFRRGAHAGGDLTISVGASLLRGGSSLAVAFGNQSAPAQPGVLRPTINSAPLMADVIETIVDVAESSPGDSPPPVAALNTAGETRVVVSTGDEVIIKVVGGTGNSPREIIVEDIANVGHAGTGALQGDGSPSGDVGGDPMIVIDLRQHAHLHAPHQSEASAGEVIVVDSRDRPAMASRNAVPGFVEVAVSAEKTADRAAQATAVQTRASIDAPRADASTGNREHAGDNSARLEASGTDVAETEPAQFETVVVAAGEGGGNEPAAASFVLVTYDELPLSGAAGVESVSAGLELVANFAADQWLQLEEAWKHLLDALSFAADDSDGKLDWACLLLWLAVATAASAATYDMLQQYLRQSRQRAELGCDTCAHVLLLDLRMPAPDAAP